MEQFQKDADGIMYKYLTYSKNIKDNALKTEERKKIAEKMEEKKKQLAEKLAKDQKLFLMKTKNFSSRTDMLIQKASEETFTNDIWKAIKVDHEELKLLFESIVVDTEEADVDQYKTAYKNEVTTPFDNVLEKLVPKIKKVEKQSGIENVESSLKMMKLEFPKFSGDIRAYPVWKKEFTTHVAPRYGKSEQYLVLKNYVSDTIRAEIQNFSSLEDMWHFLDDRFGSSRKLIDSILHDIKTLFCFNI